MRMTENTNNSASNDVNRKGVLVISPSEVYRDTLKTYLAELNYRIDGVFETVEASYLVFRTNQPDLIIFDAITTQSELISYSSLLREEGQDIPTLVIHSGEGFTISHSKIDFLFPPISPIELEKKLEAFLVTESRESDEVRFNEFVNFTSETLLKIAPEFGRAEIQRIIQDSMEEFAGTNPATISLESDSMRVQFSEKINLEAVRPLYTRMLRNMTSKINSKMEADWGGSLIEDALESVTIALQELPQAAIDVVTEVGKGYHEVLKKFKRAVPDHITLDKNIIATKLVLTDLGPEVRLLYTSDEAFREEFDVTVASQLITLVGQGSNYHEGVFGPLPIPRTNDIIAILWSKVMNSNIQDVRMAGKTLVVVALGFRQEIINLVPDRETLGKIFSDLSSITHEENINIMLLEKIAEKFRGHLL
ncbi:MAG: hypothetical protein ACXAE3_02505 [Candidatus Kariarchaeaceae archaeon]